jgi:hypothetical protein
MKKLFTVVFTMLLAGSLAFAQTGGGTAGDKAPNDIKTGKTENAAGKKATKAHKGGKKGRKSARKGKKTDETAPATTPK